MTHDEGHEEAVLEAVFGQGTVAAAAERLVACEGCLVYAARVLEDVTLLRGGRRGEARALRRLDEALELAAVRVGESVDR